MDKGGGPTQDLLDMGGKDVSNKSNEVSFPNSGKATVVVAFQKLLTGFSLSLPSGIAGSSWDQTFLMMMMIKMINDDDGSCDNFDDGDGDMLSH